MSKDVNIMVDFETLSDKPDSCLLGVGLVKFTFEDGVYQEYYRNIEPESCKQLGFKIKRSTVEWWSKQHPDALKSFKDDQRSVQQVFSEIQEFVGHDTNASWWAHGASFDFAIIELYTEALGIPIPYKFWNLNCSRTIMNLTKTNMKTGREGIYHHALDDCKWQVKKLIEAIG